MHDTLVDVGYILPYEFFVAFGYLSIDTKVNLYLKKESYRSNSFACFGRQWLCMWMYVILSLALNDHTNIKV